MIKHIKNIFKHGTPIIHKILINDGQTFSLKRVQRYISQIGIRSIVVEKFRHYTDKRL